MATTYFFVCKECNLMLDIGRFGTAEDILPTILAEHEGHHFALGEDSDFLEGIEFLGGKSYEDIKNINQDTVEGDNFELKDKYRNSKYPPMNDFINFYKDHRVG